MCTAQKMNLSVKLFFSISQQIRSFVLIFSRLLKKSLTRNFAFFYAVVGGHYIPAFKQYLVIFYLYLVIFYPYLVIFYQYRIPFFCVFHEAWKSGGVFNSNQKRLIIKLNGFLFIQLKVDDKKRKLSKIK